jgi:hypothetical protein
MLVVLTGAGAAADPVRSQLESAGATVVTTPDDVGGAGADAVAAAIGQVAAGSVADAYVQLPTVLPIDGQIEGGSLVAQMGQFLADGLLARFRLAAAVLPHLREDATVVLVGGNTPVPGTAVDDQEARLALLRVLAHALRAEEAPRHLRVRVLPHATSPDVVARTAFGESAPEPPPQQGAPAGDSDVDLSYADWRTQVLGLATVEF